VLDIKTSTLLIGPPEPSEPQKVPTALIIQTRTETLVPVLIDEKDGITLLIHAQNIGMEGTLLGNTVNCLRDKQVLVSVINTTGEPIEFFPPQLGDVEHEIFKEVTVNICKPTKGQEYRQDRITQLTEAIRTDHLNHEERASLLRICKRYQDLFHFEGEPLSCTTAIQHDIKILEGTATVTSVHIGSRTYIDK